MINTEQDCYECEGGLHKEHLCYECDIMSMDKQTWERLKKNFEERINNAANGTKNN